MVSKPALPTVSAQHISNISNLKKRVLCNRIHPASSLWFHLHSADWDSCWLRYLHNARSIALNIQQLSSFLLGMLMHISFKNDCPVLQSLLTLRGGSPSHQDNEKLPLPWTGSAWGNLEVTQTPPSQTRGVNGLCAVPLLTRWPAQMVCSQALQAFRASDLQHFWKTSRAKTLLPCASPVAMGLEASRSQPDTALASKGLHFTQAVQNVE